MAIYDDLAEGPASALPIDPRIGQRRAEVLRAHGRRRLLMWLAVLGVVVLVAGAAGALYSPWLRVRHVTVTGEAHASQAQVLSRSGLSGHPPMIDVRPGSIAKRLQGLPWVASASVRRSWPATVSIRIEERRAVATVPVTPADTHLSPVSPPGGGRSPVPATPVPATGAPGVSVGLVDATGRVLSIVPGPVPGLPTLVGFPAPGPPGAWLDGTGPAGRSGPGAVPDGPHAAGSAAPALALAAALPSDLAGRLATISLTRDGVLTAMAVTVVGQTTTRPGRPAELTVVFGDTSELPAKLAALSTVLDQMKLSGVTGIDLRVPYRPALTSH